MTYEHKLTRMSDDELRAVVSKNASAPVGRHMTLYELFRRRRRPPQERWSVLWISLVVVVLVLIVAAVIIHDWFHPAPPAHTRANSQSSESPAFP